MACEPDGPPAPPPELSGRPQTGRYPLCRAMRFELTGEHDLRRSPVVSTSSSFHRQTKGGSDGYVERARRVGGQRQHVKQIERRAEDHDGEHQLHGQGWQREEQGWQREEEVARLGLRWASIDGSLSFKRVVPANWQTTLGLADQQVRHLEAADPRERRAPGRPESAVISSSVSPSCAS
jgi:hypothetical protein